MKVKIIQITREDIIDAKLEYAIQQALSQLMNKIDLVNYKLNSEKIGYN